MTCIKIESGYICYGKVYKYKGYFFEFHNYHGPSPLKKNGDPSLRIPAGFWDMIEEFTKLKDEEKKEYCIN